MTQLLRLFFSTCVFFSLVTTHKLSLVSNMNFATKIVVELTLFNNAMLSLLSNINFGTKSILCLIKCNVKLAKQFEFWY